MARQPITQVEINLAHSKFSHVQKFCEFKFRDLTPTVKLRENKAHARISGNMVAYPGVGKYM